MRMGFALALLALGIMPATAGPWANRDTCSPGYHRERGTSGGGPSWVTCAPDGGGGGGGAVFYAPPPPTPEELAVVRLRPRFIAVIEQLSGPLPFISREAWMSALANTPQQFVTDANNIHRIVLERIVALTSEVKGYRSNIDEMEREIGSANGRLPGARAELAKNEARLKEVEPLIPWYQGDIEFAQRKAQALGQRAALYREDAEKSRRRIAAFLKVLLPPSFAIPELDQPLADVPDLPRRDVSDPTFNPGKGLSPIVAPAVAALGEPANRRLSLNVPALAGSFDAMMSQLEADVTQARTAFQERGRLTDSSSFLAARHQDALVTIDRVIAANGRLIGEIVDKRKLAEDLRLREAAASDAAMSAEARFIRYATQAWIWQNAKKYSLDALIVYMKRNEHFALNPGIVTSTGLDATEAEVLKLYDEAKFNVLNLPGAALGARDLRDLRASIATLATNGGDYATEAARLAARCTPSEMAEFASHLFGGLDRDSEKIVQSSLDTINVPQPFATIYTKYFLKKDQ